MTNMKIRPRDRDAVLQALRAGVVPRTGQHLVQVGRSREISAMVQDIDRIADGGSAFRLVIGEYGAGKTFFLNLVRSIGMEKKLVVTTADLNPDRRLHGSSGQARSLYAELMRNIATRTRPEGGALAGVVEKFIGSSVEEARQAGDDAENVIRRKLGALTELVNGYDFADVVAAYWRGHQSGTEALKTNALRWLRGEFGTKTEAREALGVRSIIDDASVYDQLKLMSLFVRLAGYSGLLVCLDEMVNLYKMTNTQSRNMNYEQLLRYLNDSLQGSASGLGFLLGGTPEFLMHPRRGLYSYEALQSRLAQNRFADNGLVDLSGPVVRLTALSPEEFYLLLCKLRSIYALGDTARYAMPDAGIERYIEHCAKTLGNDFFRTPRTTIKSFIDLLAVLEQNPQARWEDLVGTARVERDEGGAADVVAEDADAGDLASFKL